MAARSRKNETQHAEIGTLEDLATFVAVARALSFAEAARRTRVPASTVSRAVARLENALCARLLQRTSRRVVLTAEGSQLLLRAAPSIDDLNGALRGASDAAAQASGVIRVTAPAFTGSTRVARALADFAAAHPGVTIELDASNAIRDVIEDRFDFAIRVGPLADGDLVARHLWDTEFGIFAARSLVGNDRSLTRARLLALPAVVTRGNWRFVSPDGERISIAPRTRFTVNDPRAAADVARRGVGIALLPAELAKGLVRLRPDFGTPEPARVYAVYPQRRLLPLRVKLALGWLARTTASSEA